MSHDPLHFFWAAEDVARDAFHGFRRRWTDFAEVTVAACLILCGVGASAAAAVGWMFDHWGSSSGPDPLMKLVSVIAVVVGTLFAWSASSMLQRGVVLALTRRDPRRTLREALAVTASRARPLVALAVLAALYDLAVLLVGACGTFLARDSPMQLALSLAFFASCGAAWLATRPFLGIATAHVVLARHDFAVALRTSVRELREYRLASLASRSALLPLGGAVTWMLSTSDSSAPAWLVASAVLLTLAGTFDAVVEGAWYERLHGAPHIKEVAAVFD